MPELFTTLVDEPVDPPVSFSDEVSAIGAHGAPNGDATDGAHGNDAQAAVALASGIYHAGGAGNDQFSISSSSQGGNGDWGNNGAWGLEGTLTTTQSPDGSTTFNDWGPGSPGSYGGQGGQGGDGVSLIEATTLLGGDGGDSFLITATAWAGSGGGGGAGGPGGGSQGNARSDHERVQNSVSSTGSTIRTGREGGDGGDGGDGGFAGAALAEVSGLTIDGGDGNGYVSISVQAAANPGGPGGVGGAAGNGGSGPAAGGNGGDAAFGGTASAIFTDNLIQGGQDSDSINVGLRANSGPDNNGGLGGLPGRTSNYLGFSFFDADLNQGYDWDDYSDVPGAQVLAGVGGTRGGSGDILMQFTNNEFYGGGGNDTVVISLTMSAPIPEVGGPAPTAAANYSGHDTRNGGSNYSYTGPTVFYGAAALRTGQPANVVLEFAGNIIDLGADDDQLIITVDGAASQATFGGNVFDGGDGYDSIVFYGLAGGIQAALIGFENLQGTPFDDTFVISASNETVSGGGGRDTVSYASSGAGVDVNLATGTATGGYAAGDTLTSIENVVGTAFADVLTGSAADNTLAGGLGNDTLDGGEGNDTASYASAGSGITANLAVGIGAGGDAQGDNYISIEALIGSRFGDTLVGLAGIANTLDGGNGDDFLYGEGIDTFIGGPGNDVLFGGQGSALNINLAISSIETVWGSFVGDVMDGSTSSANLTMVGQGLTGGANADTMLGGSGDDFIYYRAGDVINGGAGNDWAVATLSGSGVTLDMTATGFENAWGSTSDDLTITAAGSVATVVIVGDTGNDGMTGGNAGDFLYGFAGNDTLTGGPGNDNLVGGADTDTFAFGAGWGVDIVWDWANGTEQFNLQGSGAAGFAALTVDQNYFGSGNALISFGGNQILVVGGANQIDTGDFIF